jgi:GH15 family glucan-1,4-alpha-glucosidase
MDDPCRPIGNHGVIGNLETVALIARDGVLDYLCWPQLDSPTIFADLLDPGTGGSFSIVPELESRLRPALRS